MWPLFFGCVLIGFSPLLVTFFFMIVPRAQLVIVTLTAGFFWLISMLFASVIWYILPIKDSQSMYALTTTISVLCQEFCRLVFFRSYSRAERSFSVVSTNAIAFPLRDFYSGVAGGVGFGLTSTILFYGSIISSSSGVGTLFSDSCSIMSTFVLCAVSALLMGILHICLMVLAFDGFRRQHPLKIAIPIFLHIIAALLSMVNTFDDGCAIYLPLLFAIVVGTGFWLKHVVSDESYRSRKYHRIPSQAH